MGNNIYSQSFPYRTSFFSIRFGIGHVCVVNVFLSFLITSVILPTSTAHPIPIPFFNIIEDTPVTGFLGEARFLKPKDNEKKAEDSIVKRSKAPSKKESNFKPSGEFATTTTTTTTTPANVETTHFDMTNTPSGNLVAIVYLSTTAISETESSVTTSQPETFGGGEETTVKFEKPSGIMGRSFGGGDVENVGNQATTEGIRSETTTFPVTENEQPVTSAPEDLGQQSMYSSTENSGQQSDPETTPSTESERETTYNYMPNEELSTSNTEDYEELTTKKPRKKVDYSQLVKEAFELETSKLENESKFYTERGKSNKDEKQTNTTATTPNHATEGNNNANLSKPARKNKYYDEYNNMDQSEMIMRQMEKGDIKAFMDIPSFEEKSIRTTESEYLEGVSEMDRELEDETSTEAITTTESIITTTQITSTAVGTTHIN